MQLGWEAAVCGRVSEDDIWRGFSLHDGRGAAFLYTGGCLSWMSTLPVLHYSCPYSGGYRVGSVNLGGLIS